MPRPTRLLAIALLAGAVAPASAAADDAPVAEQIIVRHRAGLDAADRAEVRADADTSLERRMRLANTEVVAVEEGTRTEALAELRADPDVLWAAPNGVASIAAADPFWSSLYALRNLGLSGRRIDADVDAEQAWGVTKGGGVTVAVVDSGVQSNHPDLTGRVDTTSGYDFVDLDTDASDPHGHGTHVAGIVAATKDNGTGVVGIAPEATIMPVRVLASNGFGDWADIIDGFDWAAANGADVVNASIGGPFSTYWAELFRQVYAAHPSTVFVISAGNDNRNNDAYGKLPCVTSEPNVLCVGSTTDQDERSSFSNYGATTVDVFAPGSSIISTYMGSQYATMSGTSMAAPYAAGTAALVAAATGDTGADVAQTLKDTVDRPSALAGLSVTGGRINAARAVGATVDAPSQGVIQAATGGANTATVTMAQRESDINAYVVTMDGVEIGTVSARSFTVTGLPAGSHTFTVAVRNTSNMTAAASAPATVTVTNAPPAQAPVPAPVTPAPTTPITSPAITPSSPVSGVRLVKRGSYTSLVFRVTRTARVTVTLSRLQGGTYRRADSRTVRMTAGVQSLPVTSRLLGMRVPAGRWRVTVGSSTATASSIGFVKR